ncbi:glycosyltransferase family 4 protein [Synechococcus sp. EJ6-Ellesmere]|uniref:glycosyltransferase family 4 protein n=1 Tax=Synechococcus sp. EJ6-Ellesmere TaxID=2823734 RepID=UPI0020CC839F|nr:glycosyltransferase [Synechococcus sp. EJ6-Ellesmere]MCP9826037.1 glycosyltransferase [Synechococcus sp. EJ6-Ellesmere]
MKICFIQPEFKGFGGGIRIYHEYFIQNLNPGDQCLFLIGSGSVAEKSEFEINHTPSITEVRLGIARLNKWKRSFQRYSMFPTIQADLAASWALRELAEAWEPDVVEIADISLLYAAWLSSNPVPWFVQSHGSTAQLLQNDPLKGQEPISQLASLLECNTLRHVPFLATSNPKSRDTWENLIGLREIDVVAPGWAMPQSLCHSPIANTNIDSVVRIFGRFQSWKGALVVSEAISKLDSISLNVEWYGLNMPYNDCNTSMLDEVLSKFAGINQKLVLKEPVLPAEVYKLQSKALFNLVPSSWDVMNFSAIEAMASGRPLIISDGAGASCFIEDGVSGLIFKAGDASSLCESIIKMMDTSEVDRLKMASRAQKTVQKLFDPARQAQERYEYFQHLINYWPLKGVSKVPLWVEQSVSPMPVHSDQPWALLDNLPLKGLLQYTLKRLRAKFSKSGI